MADKGKSKAAGKILVLDSGIGGLSIVEHIMRRLPRSAITYVADNANFPYGLLDDTTLVHRVCALIGNIVAKQPVDIVVIACNTASTLVLPRLRAELTIPVVGVVPAIKPAAQISASGVIGLLATSGTIAREYTDELIADFAGECEVIKIGSSELVTLVERELLGDDIDISHYEETLRPLIDHPRMALVDTVVLACTHFPLVKNKLSVVAPQVQHWIDSGNAIATRVESILLESKRDVELEDGSNSSPMHQVLLTDINSIDSYCRPAFEKFGFRKIIGWNE